MSPDRRSADALVERVRAFCDAHGILRRGERAGVAFSGGADSLTLLHLLARLDRATPVLALHVDHRLQPASGDMAGAASAMGEAAGIPVEVVTARIDPRERRQHGLEAAARTARYDALAEAAARHHLDCVALGHTADDRAETLLLNLVRGAGLDGLAAMRVRRGRFVRPLLPVRRDETQDWCRSRGLRPVQDPHNTDPRLLRSRVRAELLPVLEGLRPGSTGRIAATAARLEADADLLGGIASDLVPDIVEVVPVGLHLDAARLAAAARPLAARVVRNALAGLLGSPPPAAATEAVLSGRAGSVPGTRLALRRDDAVIVVYDPAGAPPVPLPSQGSVEVLGRRYRVRAAPAGVAVQARALRPGDRVRGDTRTVADRLARLGVDRSRRDRVLVVLADGEPVGIVEEGIGWVGDPDSGVEVRPEGNEGQA